MDLWFCFIIFRNYVLIYLYLFFVFSQADSCLDKLLNTKELGKFLKIDKETPGESRLTKKAEYFPNNNGFCPGLFFEFHFRFSCFPLSRKYMDVFAGDLRFGVAPSELRLQDVLRSVLAEQNVPKAEHAPER